MINMVTTVRQYFSKAKATGKGQTLSSYISVCQKPCLLIMAGKPMLKVVDQVLQVEAVDGDHGIGNPITYSITGGPKHLFAINKLNGLVYINVSFLFGSFHHVNTSTNNRLKSKCFKAPIDRESEDARNGAFILEVGRTNGVMLQWYNGMMVVLWWLCWILDLGWNINGHSVIRAAFPRLEILLLESPNQHPGGRNWGSWWREERWLHHHGGYDHSWGDFFYNWWSSLLQLPSLMFNVGQCQGNPVQSVQLYAVQRRWTLSCSTL